MFLPSWLRLRAHVLLLVTSSSRSNRSRLRAGGVGTLVLAGALLAMPGAGWGQIMAVQVPTWSQLSPASSPSAREGAAMAYDPATGQVVLFGGTPGGPQFLTIRGRMTGPRGPSKARPPARPLDSTR